MNNPNPTAHLTSHGAQLHLTTPTRNTRLEHEHPHLTYDPTHQRYTLPATPDSIITLERHYGPISDQRDPHTPLSADPLALSLARAASHHPDRNARTRSANPPKPVTTSTPTAPPTTTATAADVTLELGSCSVRVHDARLIVSSPYDARHVLSALPEARWSREQRGWSYPATLDQLTTLKRALGAALTLDPSAEALRRSAQRGATLERSAAQHKRSDGDELPHVTTRAWRHQKQAYAFANELGRALLNMHMGTGKTLVSLALIAQNTRHAAIVLAPKRVVRVWPKEAAKHLQAPHEWHVLALSDGSTQQRNQQLLDAIDHSHNNGTKLLVAINYEAAYRKPLAQTLKSLNADVIVLDEIHRIKAPFGKASKFAAELASRSPHRYGLTGTLIPNGPEDVWAQYRALEPNLLGSWSNFEREHLHRNQFGGIAGYRNLDALHRKLERRTYRATKDVIELPPVMHHTVDVNLASKTQRLAREIYEETTAQLLEGTITTQTFLTKILRAQQLTGGYAILDDGTHAQVDSSKEQALEDLLQDTPKDEPIVVFAQFHDDLNTIERVSERLGRRYAELSGRRDELEAWQAAERDILGVQIQAGGLGIDATRASIGIYYSNTYALAAYEQSKERLHRPGQARPVQFYHLIARDSIDETLYRALRGKKNLADYVIEHKRRTTPRSQPARPAAAHRHPPAR